MREPWKFESPGCASVGGEFWFPERMPDENTFAFQSPEVTLAKSVCGSCIHKQECLQWGLKHERFGIWGGLTDSERTKIRNRLNIIVEEVGVANFATGVGYSSHEGYTST